VETKKQKVGWVWGGRDEVSSLGEASGARLECRILSFGTGIRHSPSYHRMQTATEGRMTVLSLLCMLLASLDMMNSSHLVMVMVIVHGASEREQQTRDQEPPRCEASRGGLARFRYNREFAVLYEYTNMGLPHTAYSNLLMIRTSRDPAHAMRDGPVHVLDPCSYHQEVAVLQYKDIRDFVL